MERAIVLFNRDLRVHDHPALHDALQEAEEVIPLFVVDRALTRDAPNRATFLLDSLVDLRARLRDRSGDLLVVAGDPVDEAMRVAKEHGAEAVFASADVSRYAHRREERLAAACARQRIAWRACAGVSVVPADELAPAGRDHYRVFTPYYRAWRAAPWRRPLGAPRRVRVPTSIRGEGLHDLGHLVKGTPSPDLAAGGETAARSLLQSWGGAGLARYEERHDDLAADGTSRISPYLHFGCVSPLELATRFADRPGGGAFVRQLCWRDFHHQVTESFGAIATEDYRSRGDRWRQSPDDLAAWEEGRTGYPIVDAGMRQLRQEGWMHNRARLLTASFLTKDLYLDWRLGAEHFLKWLVDGDVASNFGNWQWVAGTGNDTRPHRMFNPLRQAERFDPRGDYVRRYVPELAHLPGPAIHRPWACEQGVAAAGYPLPIVDHGEATARFRKARAG